MKKIVSIASVFAFVLLTAAPAGAAFVANDNSTINWVFSRFSRIEVENSNTAIVGNHVSATSNTGGNTIVAGQDIERTDSSTGDATSAAGVENDVNSIDSDTSVTVDNTNCLCAPSADADDNSVIDVAQNDRSIVENENENFILLGNDVTADANAGGNVMVAGQDVEDSSANTGSADSGSVVSNMLNKLKAKVSFN